MGTATDLESPLWALPNTRGYLNRLGAEPRSLKVAAVTDPVSKYRRTRTLIKFERQDDGAWTIDAPDGFRPTDAEAVLIKAELAGAKWPEWQPACGPFDKTHLPAPYSQLPDDCLFICRAAEREPGIPPEPANSRRGPEQAYCIIMVQVRVEKPGGGKNYIPLTYWNDERWRAAEPDRLLPVFGMEQLPDTGKRIIFLHEGAKAARAGRLIAEAHDIDPAQRSNGQKILAAHPWAYELAAGVHLGWIGGAERTHDTDWGELRRAAKQSGIERLVIVADNDEAGRNALPKISRAVDMPADHLIFPTVFPPAFDLADSFPIDGPGAAECLRPGTFMTRLFHNPHGKPSAVLTKAGSAEWTYIPEHALYVSTRHPAIAYDRERLNAMLRPLSDAQDTAVLIQRAAYASGRPMKLAYDPGKPEGVVADGEGAALNRHRPGKIRPRSGGATPWVEFLRYLIPRDLDRIEVERWCATLVARPGQRISYGLLLISETQGVGKSTLGYILADLVGQHNTSFPGQTDIGSEFNEWQYEKRLAVINEVYAGQSWAAYNALKNAITEPHVTLNQKFQRKVKMANWIHVVACSNSIRALKMADTDRRWFVPGITEMGWPRERFVALRMWLKAGGLGEIVTWAQTYRNFVNEGEHAPASVTKEEVVSAGRSRAATAVVGLAEAMDSAAEPLAVSVKAVRQYAHRAAYPDRVNESDQELTTLMKQRGIVKGDRIKVGSALETILINAAAQGQLDAMQEPGAANAAMRAWVKTTDPHQIAPLEI